jgi:hypothetical protein
VLLLKKNYTVLLKYRHILNYSILKIYYHKNRSFMDFFSAFSNHRYLFEQKIVNSYSDQIKNTLKQFHLNKYLGIAPKLCSFKKPLYTVKTVNKIYTNNTKMFFLLPQVSQQNYTPWRSLLYLV